MDLFSWKHVALRRVGAPLELAQLVVFLASDESSYSTGAEFVADGEGTAGHASGTSTGEVDRRHDSSHERVGHRADGTALGSSDPTDE